MSNSTPLSFPHYEINVKDNSIYNAQRTEILPVWRPLVVLRTKKGVPNTPTWCASIKDFNRLFGAESLNVYSEYFTRESFALTKSLPETGAFIVRALPEDATYGNIVLEAVVTPADIPQYERDTETGNYVYFRDNNYNYARRPAMPYADIDELFDATSDVNTTDGVVKTFTGNFENLGLSIDSYDNQPVDYNTSSDKNYYYFEGIKTIDPETGLEVYITLFKQKDAENWSYVEQLKEAGLLITYRRRIAAVGEDLTDLKIIKPKGQSTSWIFPIISASALYPGQYGNELAFCLSYPANDVRNSANNIQYFESAFYNIAFAEHDSAMDVLDYVYNKQGRTGNLFSANPNAIDKNLAKRMNGVTVGQMTLGFENTLNAAYDSDENVLPMDITFYHESVCALGNLIASFEYDSEKEDIDSYVSMVLGFDYDDDFNPTDMKTAFANSEIAGLLDSKFGYKINVLSCENPLQQKYAHTAILTADTTSSAPGLVSVNLLGTKEGRWQLSDGTQFVDVVDPKGGVLNVGDLFTEPVTPVADFWVFLVNGHDSLFGIEAPQGNDMRVNDDGWDYVIQNTWNDLLGARLKGLTNTVYDKFRYPFTHIYDFGYSINTKLNMIDFINNVRDDVGVSLTTQEFLNEKASQKRDLAPNRQELDEANGEMMRAYALLFKESILYGTDACRVTIFPHVAYPVEAGFRHYMPVTYWDFATHAKLGRMSYMDALTPFGTDHTNMDDFFETKSFNWTNYMYGDRQRVWESGLNYVMYGSQKSVFIPGLRTVYQAETSVLIGQYIVDAVIYTKHEIRKVWAHWTGTDMPAASVDENVKNELETRLRGLYNGKYTVSVDVYRTEEDTKLGYVNHVRVNLTAPGMWRVMLCDVECNREGFTPEEN